MDFIFGEEEFLINEKLKEIINSNKSSKIVFFDFSAKLDQIMNEILSFSLFESSKVVILKNFFLLSKNNETDSKSFITSLKFVPESTRIVFVLDKQIEKTKNIFIDFLKKNANLYQFNSMSEKEISNYVKKIIYDKGGIINDLNLFYFLSKVPNKLIFIVNEINKLLSLDKKITKKNIDDLVPKYDTNKFFDFINAFNDQDIEKIFKIYYEKVNQGETIINLINQMTSVLEICSQIYNYKKMNLKNNQIAEKMNKHVFVIQKNEELLTKISYKKIKKYLQRLSELDLQIKLNKIDDKIGFENFLLNIAKNN